MISLTVWLKRGRAVWLALLAGLSGTALAEAGATLNKLGFFALPGNNVQVSLNFSAPPSVPLSFTTDNPARIVLDFPNTLLDIPQKSQTVGVGAVTRINAVTAGERTRVVVELVRSTPFEMHRSEDQVVLSIGTSGEGEGEGIAASPAAQPANLAVAGGTPAAPAAADVPAASAEPAIQSIDFRRAENGAARIVATLGDPNITVDTKEEGDLIVVKFQNTDLPERLNRRLDVTDFATPVVSVDTTRKGRDVRMEIKASGQYEHMVYHIGNIYTVEVKQRVQETKELTIAEKKYSGDRLSLNFQNIDIHAVLNLLADFKGFNIVTTDSVKGTVTLRLKNVPWDQALDIILDAKGLGMRQLGNVLSIDLKTNIDERRRRELAAQQEIKKLEPVRTEFIQVNYSKAADLNTLLQVKGEHSFLSDQGTSSIDARTNTLIVQDTAESLTEIRKLIAALDKPVRQVMIEAKVVIASDDFTKDLGVKFGQSTNYRIGDNGWGAATGGKLEGDTEFPTTYAFNTSNKENFIVSLPAALSGGAGAAFGLAIGKVGSYLLQLELSALQKEGRGEIISSPRVITANQQKATIKQGVEVVVLGVAGVGAVAAPTFKELVLQLDVTPQITPDDRVIMDLLVTKDNPSTVSGAFDKREVKTQVLVDNGETVVLGGVYERTVLNIVDRVPFFGDLPVLGHLFRRTSDTDAKKELLIFVTPKILKEKASWEKS